MDNYRCPHCAEELKYISTPPLSSWGGERIYVCLNDQCPYFLESWKVLFKQTGLSMGYRYFHDCDKQSGPVMVGSPDALKDCIITDADLERESSIEEHRRLEKKELLINIDRCKNRGETQIVKWLEQFYAEKYSDDSQIKNL